MKHAIILPLKERFSKNFAGATAIWVKDFLAKSLYTKNIYVFTTKRKEEYFIKKNIIEIIDNNRLLRNYNYIKKISNILKQKNFLSAEIHNRPEYALYLLKNNEDLKINLIFHNDPNSMKGSNTFREKKYLLEKCTKIIFVSNYLKKIFLSNIGMEHSNKCIVIYNSIDKLKKFPVKKKLIVFVGKLNKAKGYDIFAKTITKILSKFKNWKAIAVGNEPREKHEIYHERFTLKKWCSHSDVLKLYKMASISVVNPSWQEPFGRTAMESASRGCAVITTLSGGLQETFNNNLILKKNDPDHLYKYLNKLLINTKLLKRTQLQNFKNVIHLLNKNVKILDNNIPKASISNKKINYLRHNNKRILHISTFGEKLNHRTYNISIAKKITNGLIRNGHDVINFDYRDYKIKFFNQDINDKIIDICENYRPDLILLGHNNILDRTALQKIKKNYKSMISIWYEDHVVKKDPSFKDNLNLLEKNHDFIDHYFITTHPNKIFTKINKNKIHFLPIPVDPSIENGEFYNTDKSTDLFFALSNGVNFGKLKKNSYDERIKFVNNLLKINNNLSFNILGLYNHQPKWNFEFLDELKFSKTALNLSRGGPNKYSTSNRLATLAGNGSAVLIDANVGYQDFFSDKEMFFYKNEKHLMNNLEKICYDKNVYKAMGRNLKKRYFEIFNNRIIADYIIFINFNERIFKSYIWNK